MLTQHRHHHHHAAANLSGVFIQPHRHGRHRHRIGDAFGDDFPMDPAEKDAAFRTCVKNALNSPAAKSKVKTCVGLSNRVHRCNGAKIPYQKGEKHAAKPAGDDFGGMDFGGLGLPPDLPLDLELPKAKALNTMLGHKAYVAPKPVVHHAPKPKPVVHIAKPAPKPVVHLHAKIVPPHYRPASRGECAGHTDLYCVEHNFAGNRMPLACGPADKENGKHMPYVDGPCGKHTDLYCLHKKFAGNHLPLGCM